MKILRVYSSGPFLSYGSFVFDLDKQRCEYHARQIVKALQMPCGLLNWQIFEDAKFVGTLKNLNEQMEKSRPILGDVMAHR